MIRKQYSYAVLVGAGLAFGEIIAARFSDNGLGAAHLVVGCILTAILTVKTTTGIMTVKTTKVVDSEG
ncbi:MAG: hypothetical protein WBF03_02245 [Xanthobacteraceae bacterium]